MNQYQITSKPRHERYMFFIDSEFTYDDLYNLFCFNQTIWGGRLNPIIPVDNNIISPSYLEIIQEFDPDIVYYSQGVNPENLKELKFFNPLKYKPIDMNYLNRGQSGFDSISMLQNHETSRIILTIDLNSSNSPFLDYFKLNYGIYPNSLLHDYSICEKHNIIEVDSDSIQSLHEIFLTKAPLINSALSRKKINALNLDTYAGINPYDTELIIAKDKSSTIDLLYYWNRMLYSCHFLIYITIEELELLIDDPNFGEILATFNNERGIKVCSNTLTTEELLLCIKDKLAPSTNGQNFQHLEINDFPYEINGGRRINENLDLINTQLLNSESGLYFIPKIPYTHKFGHSSQKWVIDLEITEIGKKYQNQKLFPYTTNVFNIIRGLPGRINKKRTISIFMDSRSVHSDNFEINLPDISTQLNQLICNPILYEETIANNFNIIGPNDSSNRLSSFIKLFDSDFHLIEDFFDDKFWIDVFEDLIKSNKVVGDTISFKDLVFKSMNIISQFSDIKLGVKGDTVFNEKNLMLGLKSTLSELCKLKVFKRGFNIKCSECSSTFWYQLQDINETSVCKGCDANIDLPIEQEFSYRLNDLIKNNIYQSKTVRDGNMTVIKTLMHLHSISINSFSFFPQVNLYEDVYSRKALTDIDIVCICDGKLIIGEAKHNSSAFFDDNNKSLKSLVDIAKKIYPDKVVLSCYEDNNNKLAKAEKGLIHLFNKWAYQPNIEAIKLPEPNYSNIGNYRYFYY